ncbi:CdaR family protein [Virgibacillus pantothenticus]|uniref:CdaR family protein n=1 Tax=Virgibacillus pantothenticus TaxID=1473 RepID=UPI0009854BA4|nr:CdaR family protein [Virgibacillus pantothenticus]
MDNWFRSKWFVRVVSLAFAVFFYIFVAVDQNSLPNNDDSTFPSGEETKNVETLDEVPVRIDINNEKYVVSGVPEYVSVKLEGSAAILQPTIRNQNFDVWVDLKGLGAGEHTVEIQHNISNKLDAYIEPKRVDVVIEEKATKEFQVNVDFLNTDKMAEGYELGDYEVSPQTVTITSAKSVIDRIGIVKAYVDVSGLDKSIDNREVPVNVYDNQGNELKVNVEPKNVVVSVNINNSSKKVPVSVETTGEPPEGYALAGISANVEEVEVFAKNSILRDLEQVSTEAIDLSKLKESSTVETSLALPDGVTVLNGESIKVKVEIEQTKASDTKANGTKASGTKTNETKTITGIPIEIEGLEDGLEAVITDPSSPEVDLTASGEQAAVAKLKKNDFRAFIDAGGLDPGTHKVPVKVESPDGLSVEPEFEQASIEISEKT